MRYYDSGCVCKELLGRKKMSFYQTQKICLVLDRIFESISDIATTGFVYFIVFYCRVIVVFVSKCFPGVSLLSVFIEVCDNFLPDYLSPHIN